MENNWERSLPFLNIDINIANELLKGVLGEEVISNIIPIKEGCRSSNYIIKIHNSNVRYILKIFPESDDNYEREINLLSLLKKDIQVQNIYHISRSEIINNRKFGLYEYIEGDTLGQAIKSGYVIEEELIRELAKSLAKIHRFKFSELGQLNKELKVINELPPLHKWYKKIMDINFKRRLGEDVIDRINKIVEKNKEILMALDNNISLVHGDFQGTNILVDNKKLAGIIDWEFSMAGHALSDIGQLFRYENYFNHNLINIFEEEYNKYSEYKLIKNWYKISKLRDLVSLIQLISYKEEMPNKYKEIRRIIMNTICIFE